MDKLRVLVCGDRYWADRSLIKETLQELDAHLVIEGECRGADLLGRKVALELGLAVMKYPADWEKYGRYAGPKRNTEMLVKGKPDLVLAFHDDWFHSKGTKNMITQAKKAGVEVRIISHESCSN